MAVFCVVLTWQDEAATMLAYHGPIAQLGERFNGIEEVKGSSPFRSIEADSFQTVYQAASPLNNQRNGS